MSNTGPESTVPPAASGGGGAGLRPARADAGESPRWWAVRRAASRKPATYRCPLCGRLLHAMSEHVLIAPEGDSSGRRHAHAACVARARAGGTLLTFDDWRAGLPGGNGRLAALRESLRRLVTRGRFEDRLR